MTTDKQDGRYGFEPGVAAKMKGASSETPKINSDAQDDSWIKATPRVMAIFAAYYKKEKTNIEDEERDLWIPLSVLERELAALTTELHEATTALSLIPIDWENKLDALTAELDAAVTFIRVLGEEVESSGDRTVTLAAIRALKKERDELKRVDDVTMTAFGKLEETCKQLHVINQALNAELHEATTALSLIPIDWENKLNAVTAERDALKHSISKLKSAMATLVENQEEVEKELLVAEAEAKALREECAIYQDLLDSEGLRLAKQRIAAISQGGKRET